LKEVLTTKDMRTIFRLTQQWGILDNIQKYDPANWW